MDRKLSIVVAGGTLTAAMAPTLAIVAVGAAVGGVAEPQKSGLSVTLWAVAAGIMFVLRWAAGAVQHTAASSLGERIDVRLQQELMETVLRPASVARLAQPGHAALVEAAGEAYRSEGIKPGHLVGNVTGLLVGRATLVGASAVLAAVDPSLGLIFFAACLWAAYEDKVAARAEAGHHYGSTEEARRTDYYWQLGLRPALAAEVRVFGLRPFLLDRFVANWRQSMKTVLAPSSRRSLVATLVLVAAVLLCLLGLLIVSLRSDRDVGRIVAGVLALMVGLDGMRQSSWTGLQTEQAAAVYERYSAAVRSLGAEELVDRAAEEVPEGDIRFEKVCFSYPDGSAVLQDLDLYIEAGRSLAIVGANGAGKTTLIKLLCRLHEPTSGRITIGGVDIATIDLRLWWAHLAVAFQDATHFGLTAADEIGWGSAADFEDSSSLELAAETAGIGGKIKRLPQGWATPLSAQFSGGVDLSGGEWQMMALARALFAAHHGASLMILDEPAAQLDARSEANLFDHLLMEHQALTTIVVSHRFSTVRRSESIVVLNGGSVEEQGTHSELLAIGGRYAEMFRLQASQHEPEAEG